MANQLKDTISLIESKRFISRSLAGILYGLIMQIATEIDKLDKGKRDNNQDIIQKQSGANILDRDLRISIEKVDEFMNQISELGILRNSFEIPD